jgi:hypothetical protein
VIPDSLKRELRLRAQALRKPNGPSGLDRIEAQAQGAVDCKGCGALCVPAYPTWHVCDSCRAEHRLSLQSVRERQWENAVQ